MAATLTCTTRHAPTGLGAAGSFGFNLANHVGDVPAAVEANRTALAVSLGLDRAALAFMSQVHGNAVATVAGAQGPGLVPEVDAIVTTEPGLALVVMVADCVPLLLADDDAGIVAAVHAGRRGVQLGVAVNAVGRMRELGACHIRAVIGPHICGLCYEVGADVQAEVVAEVPATRTTTRTGRPGLDLAAGLRAQLQTEGVERISETGGCTAESADLYSYRRDGLTGRFAGVAVLSA